MDMRSGSTGVHTSASAAVPTSSATMASPATNATCGRLLIPDARVEEGVRHVDGKIDGHDAGGDEQGHALHHRQVASGDGAEGQAPEPGQREHGFEDDAARE